MQKKKKKVRSCTLSAGPLIYRVCYCECVVVLETVVSLCLTQIVFHRKNASAPQLSQTLTEDTRQAEEMFTQEKKTADIFKSPVTS